MEIQVYSIIECNGTLYRVLEFKEKYLVVDCMKRTMPKWIDISEYVLKAEEDLLIATNTVIREELNIQEQKTVNEKYSLIAPILPAVGEKYQADMIRKIADNSKISERTIKTYLVQYLIFQNKNIFAPPENKEKVLTVYEKNFRWALNKYYFTKNGKSLSDTYIMLLKEKYTDLSGNLIEPYPSIYQLRYYFKKNKSIQQTIISRNGLKDYQMNYRPLLGDSVQAFANVIGVGMLDGTVCDIYLRDKSGNVVGRPILTACIDCFSGLCCGYSLSWEGGTYSIRSLLLNTVTDKVRWCEERGILINQADWNCNSLMGIYITDRGSEYTGSTFEQITELGCKVINLPSYRGELKGPVEKFFDLVQESYKPYLKGRGVIENDFRKRGGHDYRQDSTLTIEDFEKIVIHAILHYNRGRSLENFPYTEELLSSEVAPYSADIWNYYKEHGYSDLIEVSKEQLVLTLLPRAEGRFTRKGLVVNGIRYSAEGYTERYLSGGNVVVAYNPEDSTTVYLVEDNYAPFEIIEDRFRDLTIFQVEDMRKRRLALTQECREQDIQAKINLVSHIQAIAEQSQSGSVNLKGIRRTRNKEQRSKHRDFLSEVKKND